ncbi:hypothetical protein [uncultured Tateyamaria sp.]|uniref:hypothetical protein n=1 Tax=uncultured Tateyamaria sp. TaxID=455651 RepID=UPI00260A9B70|nr:hypothetical protein [uncultured Tateyamaria sp.]
MKHIPLILSLVGSLALPTETVARDLVFGLSPHQSSASAKTQVETALVFAATHLMVGETALFFDAAKVRLLGSFTVPEGKAYENVRARLQANRPLVVELKAFIDGAQAVPGRIGASDWPGLFELLRSAYPTDDGAALVLLGAPIADDPQAPSMSMVGGRVPNDGHVAATGAASPYGTSGLPGTLEGYDVFIGTPRDTWYVSDAHEHAVTRFWSVTSEAHGASLAFYGDDIATLFRLVERGATGRPHAEPLAPTDKLEMLTFAPDNGTVPALYQARPEEAPAPAPMWQNALNVTVGATWQQNVDIDLYVRPSPQAEVIYYGNADTSQGRLFKDVTVRPGTAFETVALTGSAVDLSQMQIALNYYGGGTTASGVTGELRMAIGEQVWAAPFHIPATRGNKGAGAEAVLVEHVVPNDAWTLLDPLHVIGGE